MGVKFIESAPVLLFLLLAAGAAVAVFGPILKDSIKTGVVTTKQGDVRRDQSPTMYWFAVSVLVLCVLGLPTILTLAAIALLADGID